MDNQAVQLYMEEHGHGLPVVFIHGFPLDHTIWNPIVPLLSDHARLILVDLRGHGQSPHTEGSYSMRLLSDDILALLDRLEIDRAVLVGHSMGGYISLNFARAHPNRLAGLALVATQAAADTPERRQNRLITAEEIQRRGVKHVVQTMSEKYSASSVIRETVQTMFLQTPAQSIIQSLKGIAERPDANEWLPDIRVPTLVLAGADDALIPSERAHTMEQLLGWSWLVEVPETGHMLMMEKPEVAAAALRQLIHTIESNAGQR